MNSSQEAETVARMVAADSFGSVRISYDDARRLVYDIGPAGPAITDGRLTIWSAAT